MPLKRNQWLQGSILISMNMRPLWGKESMFGKQISLGHPEMALAIGRFFSSFLLGEKGDHTFICTIIFVPYKVET